MDVANQESGTPAPPAPAAADLLNLMKSSLETTVTAKCDHCKCDEPCQQEMAERISKVPRYLFVYLPRTIYAKVDTKFSIFKCTKPLRVPEKLVVGDLVKEGAVLNPNLVNIESCKENISGKECSGVQEATLGITLTFNYSLASHSPPSLNPKANEVKEDPLNLKVLPARSGGKDQEEEDLRRAIEESLKTSPMPNNKSFDASVSYSEAELNSLTEEQQLQVAISRSMIQSSPETTPVATKLPPSPESDKGEPTNHHHHHSEDPADKTFLYHLTSIVRHIGVDASTGHYVADVYRSCVLLAIKAEF